MQRIDEKKKKKKKTSNVDDADEVEEVARRKSCLNGMAVRSIGRAINDTVDGFSVLKSGLEGNIDVVGLHAITVTCNTRLRRRGEDILR